MKNMKIKTKLILGFAIPIILTIINVLVGVVVTKGAVANITAMNQATVQQVDDGMDRLVAAISQMREESAQGVNAELMKMDDIDDNERATLMEFINASKDESIATMEQYGDSLKEFVDSGMDNSMAELQDTMNLSNLVSVILLAVSVVITLIISTALIKTIAQSIRQR